MFCQFLRTDFVHGTGENLTICKIVDLTKWVD